MNPVIFVVGPTACGKSRLAYQLAEALGGGIFNCDSLQVYKRLDIGTAKPPLTERRSLPHFLFDVLEPGAVLTAGDFRRMAMAELHKNLPKGPAIAVGGSGFYIQALEKGMFEVEKPSPEADREVRGKLEEKGLEALYAELQKLDPEYAEDISPNDSYRIVRALVVIHGGGKKMSQLKKDFKPEPFPFPHVKLGLNLEREQLLPRVEQRTRNMLADGLVAEVEALIKDGWDQWPALMSVGYKECVDHLRGQLPREQLAAQITEKTMQLAKKQRTWFKRDAAIHWLTNENPLAEALQYVKTTLRYPR